MNAREPRPRQPKDPDEKTSPRKMQALRELTLADALGPVATTFARLAIAIRATVQRKHAANRDAVAKLIGRLHKARLKLDDGVNEVRDVAQALGNIGSDTHGLELPALLPERYAADDLFQLFARMLALDDVTERAHMLHAQLDKTAEGAHADERIEETIARNWPGSSYVAIVEVPGLFPQHVGKNSDELQDTAERKFIDRRRDEQSAAAARAQRDEHAGAAIADRDVPRSEEQYAERALAMNAAIAQQRQRWEADRAKRERRQQNAKERRPREGRWHGMPPDIKDSYDRMVERKSRPK